MSDDAPPLTDARLVHLAAQVLALVTQTRSLQADEHAAAGAVAAVEEVRGGG